MGTTGRSGVDIGISTQMFSLVWKFPFSVGIGGLLTGAVVIVLLLFLLALFIF